MIVNNFKKFAEFINFESDLDFYFIQIFGWRTKKPVLIDTFYIYSKESLIKHETLIRDKCIKNNAEARIKIRKRNIKLVSLETISRTSMFIAKEKFRPIKNVYRRVCEYLPDKKKMWLLKFSDLTVYPKIINYLKEGGHNYYRFEAPEDLQFLIAVPPFEGREFKTLFNSVEILTDGSITLFSDLKY